MLCPRPGSMSRLSSDARHDADAARMPAWLCPQAPRKHRLQGDAQLVRSDRSGQYTRLIFISSKASVFGLLFIADSMGLALAGLTWRSFKVTNFGSK